MQTIAFDDLAAQLPQNARAYLTARGFTSTRLVAMVAATEEIFVDKVVDPFIAGFVLAGVTH
eukprot:11365426-Heterocapsa_arctica.AAC.1